MPDETKETQPLIRDLLEEMRGGFARMEARFDRIEARLDAIEKRLTIIEKKIDILNNQMLHITAEHELFEERLAKLENPSGIQ